MIKKAFVLLFLLVDFIPSTSQNLDFLKNIFKVREDSERVHVNYYRPKYRLHQNYACPAL